MAVVVTSPPLGFITINVDPVLHLGPLPIHWYGIMYALAFIVAYRFGVLPYATRRGIPKVVAEKITVWTIIFGLLGGRLYYVVQQPNLWNHYVLDPINIIAFWQGGMAFFGAIMVGFATLAICAWRYGYNPWIALDGGVLFAVVGQPIGRIGNIINGDILGAPSTLPWATAYTNPNAILQSCCRLGVPYQPAAAYEALGTIIIGVILYLWLRRNPRAGTHRHRVRRSVRDQPAHPLRVPCQRAAGTARSSPGTVDLDRGARPCCAGALCPLALDAREIRQE